MFINGFEFGLSGIGFMFQGGAILFNLGVWLGVSLFGALQGGLIVWMFRRFVSGSK